MSWGEVRSERVIMPVQAMNAAMASGFLWQRGALGGRTRERIGCARLMEPRKEGAATSAAAVKQMQNEGSAKLRRKRSFSMQTADKTQPARRRRQSATISSNLLEHGAESRGVMRR